MKSRAALRRLHVWLGWVVGVPLLFWTASGLWMVARPIDEVRGTALRAAPPLIALPGTLRPPQGNGAVRGLAIEMQARGPAWLVTWADGRQSRADAATGRPLPAVGPREAEAIARAAYLPGGAILTVRRFAAGDAPGDLRQPRPAWQVAFADRANVYVDVETGRLLAIRTAQWRAFDWMWGLHIMDLKDREATSHPILIVFAAAALATVVLAMVLLPMAGRRRRGGGR